MIFSSWGVKQSPQEPNPNALWGAYGHNDERDVIRTNMDVQTVQRSADQLIITFTNMTQQGGDLTIWWDDQVATVPFRVAS